MNKKLLKTELLDKTQTIKFQDKKEKKKKNKQTAGLFMSGKK